MRLMQPGEELLSQPNACAVIPGRSKDPEGFIDTGNTAPGWDPYIYISATAVKEMARMLGMVPKEEVEGALATVEEAKADLETALAEIERLRPVEEALASVTFLKSTPDPVAA